MKAGKYTVEITHPDKVLFPKENITKEEIANYYLEVAPLLLPLLKGRPISMHRFPEGIKKEGFFQKQAPDTLPSWIKVVKVGRKGKTAISMLLCQEKATLLWLANQNCITPHIWLSQIDHPDLPDRLIFDLDPPNKKKFPWVVKGALLLKEILEKEGNLQPFVMTTGSKGLHVVIPLKPEFSFAKVRSFAQKIAEQVVEQDPKLFTLEVRKEKRKGKVFIDVLRNGLHQTVVAPYSIRALDGAPIATPLFWEELQDKTLTSSRYTLRTIQTRLKKNPWKGIEKGASLPFISS